MNRSELNQADYDFLVANARAGRAMRLAHFTHLDQPVGIWNYIRIADDIARRVPRGHVLDWGCGYGQMTYLLQRRGFRVTAFDIGPADKAMPDIPLCRALRAVYVPHPTHLPFEAGVFDAVLCCGVLEHVEESNPRGNAVESLRELARVLRPHGRLLIYQLPQRCAWQEAVVRRLRLGYAHPRRYSEDEITGMLRETGYRVQGVRRANLFPRNLTCLPEWLRATYSLFSHAVIALDGVLCGVPGLNRLAGVVEVCAQRDAEHAARPEGPAQAAR